MNAFSILESAMERNISQYSYAKKKIPTPIFNIEFEMAFPADIPKGGRETRPNGHSSNWPPGELPHLNL